MSADEGSQGGVGDVRHVGADITKSDAVLIVVDGNGLPVVDPLDILSPSEHGSPGEVLLDLKSRAIEHLRRLGPASVSVYGPAKYANWKFHDLRPRCQIEAALLLAAAELGVSVFEQTPQACGKAVGLKYTEIEKKLPALVDLSGFTRKGRRAKALAAVLSSAGIELRGAGDGGE